MDMTIDQQVALDEALVPHASRLRIGNSNFCLRSDITPKESTLQVVYDVLKLTPFHKAFLVTADVLEIYMQEFWVTATVHHHSIRFKMNNKKRIVNLEYFREMLHIYPRIPNQTFDELPIEEEILAFVRNLGHSREIKITNVNINKLHQPWRSFATVINKFLSGKSTGYDIEHKDAKKSNEMYYPGSQRDDQMFTMIKLVSRHQNTQQFGAILPVELTNEDIRNTASYKEYYAIASGAAPPKTKATKGKQPTKSSKAKGLSMLSEVALTEAEQMKLATKRSLQQTHISQASGSGADEGTGNDDESHGMNVRGDEGPDAEDDDEELYGDVNINLEGQDIQMTDVHTTQVLKDTYVTLPPVNPDVTTTVEPLLLSAPTLPSPSIPIISLVQQAPIKKTVNEQLEAEVLTRASNSSKTSYVVAADLSELELKKILIEKMESNKSIHRSDEQRNFYKALVDAYECDKIILDTYGDTVTLKRRRDDEDKDKKPSAGSDRGSKRRRAGKEPESTSAPKEKASKTSGKSTEGSKSYQKTASESAPAEELMHITQDLEEPTHKEFETGATDDQPIAEASQHPECIQPWISNLAKQADSRTSFNELMDTPVDFLAFLINRLKVDTLTPELLAGPTFELMKGSCKSLVELEFFLEEVYKAKTNQLD
nr:hypothetical protein [Tanacetum cinerariifolium]